MTFDDWYKEYDAKYSYPYEWGRYNMEEAFEAGMQEGLSKAKQEPSKAVARLLQAQGKIEDGTG